MPNPPKEAAGPGQRDLWFSPLVARRTAAAR
jgi:hypothetical protein